MAILSKGTTYADGGQITSTNLNALVDSATFATGAVAGNGVELNGSGQLEVRGNIDIGTSNLTATGAISLGATTFNDNNITHVGSIALDTIIADNTDVTIDVAGDIILDAGGADILLKDDGTQFGRLANSSSNLVVASSVSDKDILLQGSDGGSTITALTLDMSAAGAATFNDKITAVGTSVFTNLDISGDVDVDGTANLDIVDIDGAVDMASTLQVDGVATFTGRDIHSGGITIANAGQIGSVGDADAIAIASDGVVTLTQKLIGTELDISGNIDVDGTTNLDVVDIDGAVDMATTLSVTGNVTLGGQLIMPDVTSTKMLVADGTSYQEVSISGDVTIANTGAVTIAANAVEGSMLNNNVISGQTALTSGLATDDELLVSDAGTLKRMDVSVLTTLTDDNATALAIALG